MLVFSRNRDEQIMIGENVVVTVVDIRGDKVRLGISAPKEVPVMRLEVREGVEKNLFEGYLENQNYTRALEIYSRGFYQPHKAQASQLLEGLKNSGALTDTIKQNLESYIARHGQ
jgi:carbon storage regulator